MGYAVLHMEKTSGTDTAMSAHIERTIKPKNADESRTHLNRELIKVFLMLWNQKKHSNDACVDDDDDGETDDAVVRRTTKFTEFILSVFLSVWFIMGNVWFYKIWKPNFEQPLHEPSNWCHMTVFRYTFYHLVTCYGLIALVVITTSCFIIYYCCKKYHYLK